MPIAHFMSSGFDSVLIAAIAKKELNYKLSTYTVRTSVNNKEIIVVIFFINNVVYFILSIFL